MDAILEKLFGGSATVKTMRLFLFNDDLVLTHDEISTKVKENPEWVKNAVDYLEKLGFLKKKTAIKETQNNKLHGKRIKTSKIRKPAWYINPNFALTDALRQFFYRANVVSPKSILSKLNQVGNLKLVTISGIFLEDPDARLDLLVIGDNLKRTVLEKAVGSIEALLGREVRYASFETQEFLYRFGMYDKLLRDVFDYQHEKILNKLAIFGEE